MRRALSLLTVLLVIDLLVLPQIAGPRKALSLLGRVNIGYVVLGIVLEAGSLAAYALLTRAVLPPNARPRLGTIARIDLSTLAVSHVIPAGSVGGSGLGYRLLTAAGVGGTDAAFAVATQGIGSALVLNLLLWAVLIVSIPLQGFSPLYGTAALLGTILLTAFGLLVLLILRGEARADRALRAVVRHLPLLREEMVAGLVRHIAERLRQLLTDRRLLLKAIGWASANWLLDAASLWVFLAAFSHHFLSPIDLLVAYGLGNVLAVIPVTPAGLGVIEWVIPTALVGFGLGRGVALLAVIAWRLVNFWLPIPVGALAYLSLRVEPRGPRKRRLEELRQMAEEEAERRNEQARHEPAGRTPAHEPAGSQPARGT